jgi:hypothetical protein
VNLFGILLILSAIEVHKYKLKVIFRLNLKYFLSLEINQNWGIFTRERKPKAAAKVIRCRYWTLAGMLKEVADGDFYCPAV